MLILGRKPGEQILIGDNIVVTLLAVEGGRAKLAIDAPKNMRIARAELEKEDDQ